MKFLLQWLARLLTWHKAWRQLQDLGYLARAGRTQSETCQSSSFKAFEAWVQEAQTAYDASDINATTESLEQAVATFERLDQRARNELARQAAATRAREYQMHVANCCQ